MKDLTSADFYTEIIRESYQKLVVLQFWAPWCGPCHTLTETMERMEKSKKYPVYFKRLDVDKYTDIALEYNVMGVPHTKIFASGFSLDDFSDPLSTHEIDLFIKNALLTTQYLRYSHHAKPENTEYVQLLERNASSSPRKDQYSLTLAKYFLFTDIDKSKHYLDSIHDESSYFEEKLFLRDLYPFIQLGYESGQVQNKLWSAKNAFLRKDFNSTYQFLLQANLISESESTDNARLVLLAFKSFLGQNHELNRKYHDQFQTIIDATSGQ